MTPIEAEWRFLRGWSKEELDQGLKELSVMDRGFRVSDASTWKKQFIEKTVAREAPGRPEKYGAFERIKKAVVLYEFSDPKIVKGHFDREVPLLDRKMLLELQPPGFSFLCGTVVADVSETENGSETTFGYRYDTLENHIESGMEWFLLRKNHQTGEIVFRIEASWTPGRFPNWWSKAGFFLLARRYQRLWHRHAFSRLRAKGAKPPEKTDHRLRTALAAGSATGMRSFSALRALARRRHYRFERLIVALAILEMIGDKLPFTPNRTDPAPLLARMGLGALTASLATLDRRFAPVGALAALASTFAAFHLRKALSHRLGRDSLPAVLEDFVCTHLAGSLSVGSLEA